MTLTMSRVKASNEFVAGELCAPLKDMSGERASKGTLGALLASEGYVFLRNVLPPADVMAARAEVLERLASVGEVVAPAISARWSGQSRREELAPDLGAFWQSVCEGPNLRRLSHGRAIYAIVEEIIGAQPIAQDFLYLRAGVPGTATDLHYDYPFFARKSRKVVTCWVPIGPVPIEEGPLVIVEGSNQFADLLSDVTSLDVVEYPQKRAAFEQKVAEFARARGSRLLTADFQPGDIVVMNMFTCHGSLDNYTPDNRIRLSFDLRFQPASEPRDERFFGKSPIGITGRGYAELNGAKPLGRSWHQR